MSSKQLQKRLEKIFSEIQQIGETTPAAQEAAPEPELVLEQVTPALKPIRVSSDLPKSNHSPFYDVEPKIDVSASRILDDIATSPTTSMALPFRIDMENWASLEVGGPSNKKTWTQEDNLLVKEVADQLSLALENARLFQNAKTRAEELSVLNEIARSVSSALNLNQVVELSLDRIMDLLQPQAASIQLVQGDQLKVIGQRSKVFQLSPEQLAGMPPLVIANDPIISEAINTRQTVFINDTLLDPRWEVRPETQTVRSFMVAPLVAGTEVVGILTMDHSNPGAFTQDFAIFASSIGAQVAVAIQNASLFQNEQRRRQIADALSEIARVLSSSLDLDQIVELSATQLEKLIPIDVLTIQLLQSGMLKLILIRDKGPSSMSKEEFSKLPPQAADTYSLLSNAITSRQTILIRDTHQDPRWVDLPNSENIRSFIVVPLVAGTEVLGIITLDQYIPNAFTQEIANIASSIGAQVAVAIQNAALFESEQRRRQIADALSEIARAVSSSLDLDQVVELSLNQIGKLIPSDGLSIQFLKSGQLRLIDDRHKGQPSMSKEEISKLPTRTLADDLLISEAVNSHQAILISNTQQDPRWRVVSRAEETRSFIVVPLIAGTEVLGIITLDQFSPGAFTQDTVDLASSIGAQVAVALSNANLFGETQKTAQQLASASEIIRTISPILDLQTLLDTVVHLTQRQFGLYHAHFLLSDDDNQYLTVQACGWPEGDIHEGTPTDKHQIKVIDSTSLVAQCAREKKEIINNNVHANPNWGGNPHTPDVQSEMAMPVLAGDKMLGVLNVHSNQINSFTDRDLAIMTILAGQIGPAIQNALLFEQLQSSEKKLRRQNEYLAISGEIGRLVTSTLDQNTLLSQTVNLVCERFGYYYAGIFLLDESGKNANLLSATGDAGVEMLHRKHSLPVGSGSIVGTVTATGDSLVINNVEANPIHRPNPMLPKTRSETAIPLKVGNRIIGAIDIQATEIESFSQNDVTVLQTLSDQIAIAIENARSYEFVQKAIEEMRELDSLKSQFLANMSHELRTPLNSVIGFSRVILKGIDGPVTDLQQQDLNAIYNSGQHLLRLINDVLDLSKIEAGKMEIAIENTNIPEIIQSVTPTVEGLLKDKPIKLEKKIADKIPIVRADGTRIRQILLNLLSNAAKFTEEGSITIWAGLDTGPDNQPEVVVKVIDTGQGISEEDQKKLFMPFSQVDSSPTRRTGGTGLGLSISKAFVELHGGRIGVISEENKGSTFYFTLPLQKTVEATPDKIDQSEDKKGGDDREGKIILAIDDDAQVIGLYERYLNPQGYRVIPLTDSSQALKRVKQLKPYAITLDIMMPNQDGWRVINELKSNKETRDIPVIICSIIQEEEKGFSLGAADYLVKPILEDDLLKSLNRLNGDHSIHNVLIIDDDPDDLRLIEKILQESNQYKPILAKGGPQGWEIIEKNPPHAVILDLFMPELNGFDILGRLRTTPKLSDIPVIVISGAELTAEQQQELTNFGQSLLTKGALNEKELFELLNRSLKRLEQKQTIAEREQKGS